MGDSVADATTPRGFERLCAQILCDQGWRASTTRTSGDQGADVVADKAGIRLVLQCKLHKSPVGNKAVQEAVGARYHVRARHAAVVTGAGFTRSAIELGRSTGVHLLSPGQLRGIDRLLGVPGRVQRTCPRCNTTLLLPHSRTGWVKCPHCEVRSIFRT